MDFYSKMAKSGIREETVKAGWGCPVLWEKEKLCGAKAESAAQRGEGAAVSNKARPVRGGLSGKVTCEQRLEGHK